MVYVDRLSPKDAMNIYRFGFHIGNSYDVIEIVARSLFHAVAQMYVQYRDAHIDYYTEFK